MHDPTVGQHVVVAAHLPPTHVPGSPLGEGQQSALGLTAPMSQLPPTALQHMDSGFDEVGGAQVPCSAQQENAGTRGSHGMPSWAHIWPASPPPSRQGSMQAPVLQRARSVAALESPGSEASHAVTHAMVPHLAMQSASVVQLALASHAVAEESQRMDTHWAQTSGLAPSEAAPSCPLASGPAASPGPASA